MRERTWASSSFVRSLSWDCRTRSSSSCMQIGRMWRMRIGCAVEGVVWGKRGGWLGMQLCEGVAAHHSDTGVQVAVADLQLPQTKVVLFNP